MKFVSIKISKKNIFLLSLFGLCLFYLTFAFFFNAYAILSVDEFWFAHRIYEYKSGLPYRDFAPYKTVLGYYLLLIPMLFSKGIFHTLIFTKNTIAFINISIIFISSLWLQRFFSRSGIIMSLVLLIISDLFLTYASNIRVDLIGYWFGLFSFLLLLEKRYFLSGILLGLGFMATQKVIWYLIASNAALGIYWLMHVRDLQYIRKIILFNLAVAAMVILYILCWASVSSVETVINSVFREAAVMYHLDSYVSGRKLYWQHIITLNPLLFLLWPLSLLSLFVTDQNDHQYRVRLLSVVYAFTVFLLLIPYKQVFPYYMQVTIPVFLILYSAFFSWLFTVFRSPTLKLMIHRYSFWMIFFLYSFLLIAVMRYLHLPKAYLLISIIPFCLVLLITRHEMLKRSTMTSLLQLIFITVIFIGGIYPVMLLVAKLIGMNGHYQQANVRTINQLLADGSDYVAGIELIYNKNQPIPGIRHLGLDAIHYLYAPEDKLRPMMMASLYGDPEATIASVIANLKKSSVKFYVNNYRMMALPPEIKTYLNANYEHFFGSIYLYSPLIRANNQQFSLKFSGKYLIESERDIFINQKIYRAHGLYDLKQGDYHSQSSTPFRLKLTATIPQSLAEFSNDEWIKMIN